MGNEIRSELTFPAVIPHHQLQPQESIEYRAEFARNSGVLYFLSQQWKKD